MDDNLKTITKGAANNLEKAQKIFSYIRDNFTCTVTGILAQQSAENRVQDEERE